MIKLRILIFFLFFLTSCATIVNKKNYNVFVSSNPLKTHIQFNDSIYKLPTNLNIERSKEDLYIKLLTDTSTKDYIIKSSPNSAFLYGNLVWLYTCPVAYFIDFTNPRRFYYGKSIYLNLYDSTSIIRPKVSRIYYEYFTNSNLTNKGQINLIVSLPWVNNFYQYPENEPLKSNTGYWGLSVGLDYYYKNKKFVNFSASAVMDLFVPVIANVDYGDDHESMNSISFNFTDNFESGRFSFGYGANYSINTWEHKYYELPESPSPIYHSVKKTKQSIGLTITGYHRFFKRIYLGIAYRPTFINISPTVDLKYEHVLSLDLAFKFRVKK